MAMLFRRIEILNIFSGFRDRARVEHFAHFFCKTANISCFKRINIGLPVRRIARSLNSTQPRRSKQSNVHEQSFQKSHGQTFNPGGNHKTAKVLQFNFQLLIPAFRAMQPVQSNSKNTSVGPDGTPRIRFLFKISV